MPYGGAYGDTPPGDKLTRGDNGGIITFPGDGPGVTGTHPHSDNPSDYINGEKPKSKGSKKALSLMVKET